MGNDFSSGMFLLEMFVFRVYKKMWVQFQVTDVENKFAELDRLHANGWIRQETSASQGGRRKKSKKQKKKSNGDKTQGSGVRAFIASLKNKQPESR